MQSLPPFVIHSPSTVPEVCGMAVELGDEATVYAGGTELLLAMKLGALRYGHLIDLKGVPALSALSLTADGNALDVGGAVTYAQLLRSAAVRASVPALADVVRGVGNARVRTSGTLGGNLAFADPHSDVATIGLVLDAECEVLDAVGSRWSAFDDLLLGAYETTLEPGEVVGRVRFPAQGDRVVRYQRFRVHERPAVAVAVSAVLSDGHLHDPRIVVGAAVPVATRCPDAEAVLAGDTAGVAARAEQVGDAAMAGLDVIDDEEGSAEYKRHLAGVFVARLAVGLTDPLSGTVTR